MLFSTFCKFLKSLLHPLYRKISFDARAKDTRFAQATNHTLVQGKKTKYKKKDEKFCKKWFAEKRAFFTAIQTWRTDTADNRSQADGQRERIFPRTLGIRSINKRMSQFKCNVTF